MLRMPRQPRAYSEAHEIGCVFIVSVLVASDVVIVLVVVVVVVAVVVHDDDCYANDADAYDDTYDDAYGDVTQRLRLQRRRLRRATVTPPT